MDNVCWITGAGFGVLRLALWADVTCWAHCAVGLLGTSAFLGDVLQMVSVQGLARLPTWVPKLIALQQNQ